MKKINEQIIDLERKCESLRKDVLVYLSNAKSGHPASSLSIIEILTTLYYSELNVNPHDPRMDSRDRFVLSKGHGNMALYCLLAQKKFFDKKELLTYRQLGSNFQGHPETCTPGVDACTGSLGQGLSIGCGMALRARIDNLSYRVFVLMGDGELNEGQIWEAAMFASAYNLNNLIGIVDYNKMQHDGMSKDILSMGDLKSKWKSFGWETYSCDGHDITQIKHCLDTINRSILTMPKIIIADTIKGKGVLQYENNANAHSIHCNIEKEILELFRGED